MKYIFGVHFHEHLKWNEHVKMTASSCYGTLSTLRKIKHFADFKLRKHLAEALVLSKMDYNDIVFDPLPLYLVKRLQRIQNAATSFVIGRYATTADAVKIGWLPVQERREWHLLKTTYKALHDTSWPSYASLKVAKPLRNLRSSDSTKLTVPRVKGTFQDLASKYFNKLPNDIKNCETLVSFSIQSKNYLMNIAKERLQ